MTIYIPLLYICMELKCGFFQSENYTLNEQKCEQEITQKKSEYTKQGAKVEAVCIDIDIKTERKQDESFRKLYLRRADSY